MAAHLLLRLEAPIVSFGGEAIDNLGVTDELPGRSLLTGLLANALGWMRHEGARHERLQERLVFGVRLDREAQRQTDFQTAQLGANDRGWTTAGRMEERAGGASTYESPHLRWREQLCDASVLVVLRLEPPDEAPSLDDLEVALERPQRPLFIGRKHCLPARPILAGRMEAATVLDALCEVPRPASAAGRPVRARWSEGEGVVPGHRRIRVGDERRWVQGVHAGSRTVIEGEIAP